MYREINNALLGNIILRESDNMHIPKDESNSDYQQYLEWLKKQNDPNYDHTSRGMSA